MKTYTLDEKKFTVFSASALPNGYGHRRIAVDLINEEGQTKKFAATTDNMPDYDKASDLEGQEKREALYELIESKIESDIREWLSN